ncbi:MAG: cytochrome c3 family protein [Anaerolineales bacterium]|nr:MAG: cytochrome c3 family protein [Anaerolineales bacterium]
MNPTKKLFFFTGTLALCMVFAALVLIPTREASAIEPAKQSPNECLECHEQAGKLWEDSRHRETNVSCTVCHKLADTTGKHPEDAKYTVESETDTCLVCHAEVAGKNVAGELAISEHGKVGLTCLSCHEQHSQGLKLAPGSRTICENCHKDETREVLESTHFAAGLSCVNCHMGADKNHTLIVSVTTCGECHTDLHDAKRMLDAGLDIKVMAKPEAMVEITPLPETPAVPETEANAGGVHLPAWLLVVAGVLIGGIVAWAVFGKEPGNPSAGKPS